MLIFDFTEAELEL